MALTEQAQLNLRQIMLHEAKPNPRPMAATSVTRGFEAAAFPKIVAELSSELLVVRQKALLAARELLASPVPYVQCIAAGITPAVVALLKDPDNIVRERAAGTMEFIAAKEVGARDIVQHGGLPALLIILQDRLTTVRDNAYGALIAAARFDSTRTALGQLEKALEQVLGYALEESPSRSQQGLSLLNACVQARNNLSMVKQLIIEAQAIPAMVEFMAPSRPAPVRQLAAQLLGVITHTQSDAKIVAVRAKSVPVLLSMLGTWAGNVALATAATTALQSITLSKEGKYAVVREDHGASRLMGVLRPGFEQLCTQALACITNVAEAPEGRAQFNEENAEDVINKIWEDAEEGSLLKRAAAQAIRQCRFRFRPFELLPGGRMATNEEEEQAFKVVVNLMQNTPTPQGTPLGTPAPGTPNPASGTKSSTPSGLHSKSGTPSSMMGSKPSTPSGMMGTRQ